MPVQTRSALKYINTAKDTGRIIIEIRFRCERNCAICRCDMYGNKVYHTPCGHTFHTECFKNQLQHMPSNGDKCACCRHDLLPAIRQIDSLYNLLPPTLSNDIGDFMELLMIYNMLHGNHEIRLGNTIILPMNYIEPPQPEPFPLMDNNSNPDLSNNATNDNNLDNNSDDSNGSLDSEDIWFNNSRMFHRNIHRPYPNPTTANTTTTNVDITNNQSIDLSYNIYNTYIPYGNYEATYSTESSDEFDDLPDLIPGDIMEDEGADPYELDTYMSDIVDYPSTPTSENSGSDTETDSDNESRTISI